MSEDPIREPPPFPPMRVEQHGWLPGWVIWPLTILGGLMFLLPVLAAVWP